MKNEEGEDPLDIAIKKESLPCVQILVEFGHPIRRSQVSAAFEKSQPLIYNYLKTKFEERRQQEQISH